MKAGRAGGELTGYASDQLRWGLNEIKAPGAWKTTKGSREVVVAVIDSGIDKDIEHLDKNLWANEDEIPNDGKDNDGNGYVDDVHGWDFRNGEESSKAEDLFYHGTFVAGLIASPIDTNKGTGGVAPGIEIMDLRFLDSDGHFYTSDWDKLIESINYAVDNGADIINLSIYASMNPPPSVHRAIKRADREGVLVVGIAGNRGGQVRYLSSWDEIITVGAVNKEAEPADFTNFGNSVDIAAPGEEILSYKPGGDLASAAGTSFAAPHVAGTAALVLSENPDLSNDDLKNLLLRSARDIHSKGADQKTGHGIVDTQNSLEATSH
uniref:Peptidase S8 and S53 subtilisin kexin sedolisin n=1 Tax=uncultured organism TaxID=155900 RepID=M1PP14_9ZZZZ|nr:peptidase S8 and S53 subtilisin kexin sedolisin [uncultured organism]